MQRVNESGRSMVEMLGVLAIIGLLSVGGIAGYIQAMKSHRANETIQRLMRRAVVISGQRQLGQNASLAGFNENDGTYTMTLNEGASGNATTFTMGVSGVPEEVCTRIKNMDWKIATVSDDCATFTFNNDLTERSSESGSGEGSEDGTEQELGLKQNVPCGDGFCYEGQTCTDAVEIPGDGYRCGGNYLSEPGKCCSDENNNGCSNSEPIWNESAYSCITCSGSDEFAVNVDGKYICCQKGTGGEWNGSGVSYARYPFEARAICCTSQGGFVPDGNDGCCRGNGYTLSGEVHGACCEDVGNAAIGRKGSEYYLIGSSSFDPNEYDEWHCCNYHNGGNTGPYKEFCDKGDNEA